MKIPPVSQPVEPEQNPLPKGGGSSTIILSLFCTLVYFSIPTIYNDFTNKKRVLVNRATCLTKELGL